MAIASKSISNHFGLEVQDVMDEFRRYCRDRYLHSCAETFPWRQPVLYWICCDMRSEMNQRNLTTPELEKRAAHHLKTWAQKVDRGEAVPVPVPLLSEKPRAKAQSGPGPGHAAAMAMLSRIRSKNQI
ncbi:replication protein [Erwinia aphidicola]|nr:replication protein [Erwinia aphidicola]